MPNIPMVVEVCASYIVTELAVAYRLSLLAKINACLVKSDRIERCEHSDVRKDRCVVLAVAVAVGRYVGNEADMEARSSADDGCRVFSHSAA